MGMKTFAQINAAGVCVGQLDTSADIDAPHMIPIAAGEQRLGWKWDGKAWTQPAPNAAEQADAELRQVDAATGMSRTTREALIAIAKKIGADVTYLEQQEAKAVAARARRGG